MLAELFDKVYETIKAAQEPHTIHTGRHARSVYLPDGKHVSVVDDVPELDRRCCTFESFVRSCNQELGDQSVVWVGPRSAIMECGDVYRENTITYKYPMSPESRQVQELVDGLRLSQADAITWLHRFFPESSDRLIALLKKVTWASAHTASVTNASVGKNVVAEMTATESIPDCIMLSFHVTCDPSLASIDVIKVEMCISAVTTTQEIEFSVRPGQVEREMALLGMRITDQCVENITERSYCGTPS